jgi:peptidyl-prolyl cis-trans isomerase C
MSRFGAHVVRLDALARGDVLPFGYVHAAIADYLAERQWRRDVAAYVGRLVQGAQIEGVDMSPAAHRKDDAA